MGNYYEEELQAKILADRRREERDRMRLKRRKIRRLRWFLTKQLPFYLICLAILVGIGFGIRGIYKLIASRFEEEPEQAAVITEVGETSINMDAANELQGSDDTALALGEGDLQSDDLTEQVKYYADRADDVKDLPEVARATNGIYIDVNNKTILLDRGGKDRIVPASMTKVLTLLVACEHISNLDDTYTVTPEATWFSYHNDLSAVGFANEEVVTVRDLLYGTILPSGGDAAMSLAMYVAGTHEAFVDMMNEKVDELGLSDSTHFTNCAGLYDENHYSTCYDIAIIMMATMDNELCREILCEHKYTTSQTPEHPQGIEISNWFLRRIEDKDCGYFVAGAKTGFVNESGFNAVSLAVAPDGNEYICVTINSGGNWKCIYDHARIYASQSGTPL